MKLVAILLGLNLFVVVGGAVAYLSVADIKMGCTDLGPNPLSNQQNPRVYP